MRQNPLHRYCEIQTTGNGGPPGRSWCALGSQPSAGDPSNPGDPSNSGNRGEQGSLKDTVCNAVSEAATLAGAALGVGHSREGSRIGTATLSGATGKEIVIWLGSSCIGHHKGNWLSSRTSSSWFILRLSLGDEAIPAITEEGRV